jgi:hypothetical protein
MDKNIIKKFLTERFLSEAATPGISVTDAAQKKSEKINKDGVKAIEKDTKGFDKSMNKETEPVKFNYTDKKEETYHSEMEIMNGQEMIEYDREPSKEFKDKAKEGLVGSSRMGNKAGKDTANADATWNASSDEFGKDYVKRVKDTTKKRNDAYDRVISFGDDVETVPKGQKPMAKHSSLNEHMDNTIDPSYTHFAIMKSNGKIIDGWDYSGSDVEDIKAFTKQDLIDNFPDNKLSDFKVVTKKGLEKSSINPFDAKNWASSLQESNPYGSEEENEFYNKEKTENPNPQDLGKNNNNKKPQIKESMKRLKFNTLFNGVGNALKMIPESYRTDNKTFEMTDGNESYKIRWEGTLTEGKAIVLMASDKTMINEDMAKMKHLMGYKSQDTLGTVKGNARLDENAVFGNIWAKSKVLLEGEDIEGQSADKGEWDKISKKASEATKDIEGSTSNDKGTQAPKVKTSTGEALDSAVPQAKEAKKEVEGSVEKIVGLGLGEKAPEGEWEDISVPQGAAHGNPSKTTYAPKPTNGEWDKINVPQASDAKKHVSMKEGIEGGGITFRPIRIIENDNANAEAKFKKKVASGEKTQAEYDKWIENKGKFDESLEDEKDDMLSEEDDMDEKDI